MKNGKIDIKKASNKKLLKEFATVMQSQESVVITCSHSNLFSSVKAPDENIFDWLHDYAKELEAEILDRMIAGKKR